MNTDELSRLAKMISDLANSNLDQLKGKCQNKDDIQDYYLGILQRQAILLSDLAALLKNRNSKYISTPYILLRSLLDDFLHLVYFHLCKERDSEIIKVNAVAYKQSFVSLKNLTDSNYENFEGEYPFYLKEEEVEELKKTFVSKPENQKYFQHPSRFKFKKFMTFNTLVHRITHS